MASPEVSIVLPTCNRLQYLRPAVASVFAQTFGDWELIVADDGSDEETAAYLAGLANPPRVNVIRLSHTGNPATVRNAAWRTARGEYIAFLDSDDVWLPAKLALQVASLRSRPERGWSHTAFAAIDESGELLRGTRARSWPAAEGWILERLVKMEISVAIPSVIVRRPLLEKIAGFDPKLRTCEDYDLWLRLAGLSEIDGVHETVTYKRSHPKPFYYHNTMVFEDLGRALAKLVAADSDRSVHSILCRSRAKVAAGLARSQAIDGCRWAALRTLARSSPYSWGYREWWLGGAEAAARAVSPPRILHAARAVVGRGGGAT